MSERNFLINISALYRNVQKYFDKTMAKYDIGSGQLTFLFLIHEQEGVTMQEVSHSSEVDKGTATKSIQKLMEQGYIQQRTDENDRRVKRLYTTEKALGIMNELYELRNSCKVQLSKNVDMEQFEPLLNKVTANSRLYLNPEPLYSGIRIGGLQKLTLLDYPGKAAAVIFTAGCEFKCPFCHNRDLVFLPDSFEPYDPDEILTYLKKRKGILDGVVISGGEPLIQDGLEELITSLKQLGYQVKLDTNGYFPERLEAIVKAGLVDYVAMDIKNSFSKYAETIGINAGSFDVSRIQKSIAFLKEGNVAYEFRTTVVKELHTDEDLRDIAKMIEGAEHYYLQPYNPSENVIQKGYSAYSNEEMESLLEVVRKQVPMAELRGMKNV